MAKNSYPLSYVSNSLNKIVSEFLTEYSEELQKKAEEVTEEVAKDFATKLKQVTPRSQGTGEHLADSIKISVVSKKSYGTISRIRVVHFGKWQISHLLEFGWTARNGRRINRTPFVRPLFDTNKEKYYQMYKEKLK